MNYVFLFRGAGEKDMLVWLFIVALIGLLLGGKWLTHRLQMWVHHRRMQHQWPFR